MRELRSGQHIVWYPSAPSISRKWIDDNRHLLKPPSATSRCSATASSSSWWVGGPNSRKDFHVDPGEEFFYQLEGDMLLEDSAGRGKWWTCPSARAKSCSCRQTCPYSPRRFANTVGLVGRAPGRRPGEQDGFQWYCERCGSPPLRGVGAHQRYRKQLPPIFERFFNSIERRTCRNCGTVQERPGK